MVLKFHAEPLILYKMRAIFRELIERPGTYKLSSQTSVNDTTDFSQSKLLIMMTSHRYSFALLTGALFGLGLSVAQMIDPAKVLNFLKQKSKHHLQWRLPLFWAYPPAPGSQWIRVWPG